MPLSMDTRPSAYAVIIEQGKILLTRWVPADGKTPAWSLPGGGIDPGEQPYDTVVREVFEETGYDAAPEDLLGVDAGYFDPNAGSDRIFCALRIVYRAHIEGGTLRHEIGGSSDQAKWVPISELDKIQKVHLVDAAATMMGYANSTDWARRFRERKLAK